MLDFGVLTAHSGTAVEVNFVDCKPTLSSTANLSLTIGLFVYTTQMALVVYLVYYGCFYDHFLGNFGFITSSNKGQDCLEAVCFNLAPDGTLINLQIKD